MALSDAQRDRESLTLTYTGDFNAPPERVWQLWDDARLLERWWGPPGWPATFERHEFAPGGTSHYFMKGPQGERAHGWWRIQSIDPGHAIEFDDGFADETGMPEPSLPTIHERVELQPSEQGTHMVLTAQFDSLEDMQQLLDMGADEGTREAIEQMDELLREE